MTKTTLLAIAVALALPAAARADSVSGKFELNGKPFAPAEVTAFRTRSTLDAREILSQVMLTAKPLDKQAIATSIRPEIDAINDPGADGDRMIVVVDAAGVATVNAKVNGVQYLDSSGEIMRQPGGLVANCNVNTPQRVACSVKTKKPVDVGDDGTWTLDVTFDTAVLSRAPGKALANDGAAPGKAYMGLAKALDGNDLEAILAFLVADEADDYREDWRSVEENLAAAKDLYSSRVPKKAKITGGELLADDYALLEVEGEPWDGYRMLYLVEMRLVDGKWLFASSASEGMLR